MRNQFSGRKALLDPVFGSESVNRYVVECVTRERTRRFRRVLVTFYPRDAEGTSDFFKKVGDGCQKVDIVGLSTSPCTWAGHHLDFAYCSLAIYDPAEFATMGESPEPRNSSNQEERSSEASEFASGGRSEFDRAVDGAGALEENGIGGTEEAPAKCADVGGKTTVCDDFEATFGSKGSPKDFVGRDLFVMM